MLRTLSRTLLRVALSLPGQWRGLVAAWLLAAVLPAPAAGQSVTAGTTARYTLSGYVSDAETGEKLIGTALYAPTWRVGTTTNAYGFFSLKLPADSVRLVVSYLGYEPLTLDLRMDRDRQLALALEPVALEAGEVEVVADRADAIQERTQMSAVQLPVAQIRRTPVLLGEADVLKTLQLLPGAQSGSEGTSGLYVRGGGPDQNLLLLDGAPLYNVSHLFGFFSVFNADVVKHVELIKGGFPARYGGRLSSVVEVSMEDGNMKTYETEGAIGLIASRLAVQGPIWKDKTSFIVSGRRTYADLLVRPFLPPDEVFGYYFYDVNAKINHVFSPRDRVFLSLYTGDDRFYQQLEDDYPGGSDSFRFDFGWGNVTSTLRWNHLFNDQLFGSATLLYSRYRFDIDSENRYTDTFGGEEEEESFRLLYTSGIRDAGGRLDFDYLPGPNHAIRFGAQVIHHAFRPGAAQYNERVTGEAPTDTTLAPSEATRALEVAVYVEDDVRLSRRLKANVGVHASGFAVGETFYRSVEPRVSARLLLTEAWAVKASYAAMQQYVHLLSNSSIGLPTDLWVPATDRVRPQRAHQVALGVARPLRGGQYEFSLEGYYKTMQNLIEYEEGASFATAVDEDWQDKVERGHGWSYGAELLLQRKMGKTTGWLGYTLSWTHRQFDALNEGRAFPYRYDRRHDVALVLAHRLSERLDLSATWVYGTGNAVTMPEARYGLISPDEWNAKYLFIDEFQAYSDRNAYRMRAYHRLDLGARFIWPTERGEHVLTLGLYNAYNRKNPFFLYTEEGEEVYQGDGQWKRGERTAKQVTLFPAIPSVSYRFKF